MKNINNISQKWRKRTVIVLLLNFFITPLYGAFPQEKCNGVCEIESIIHEFGSCKTDMLEMTCCDMMEMNSTNSNKVSDNCGMELSDMTCALFSQTQILNVYLVPKTFDQKIEFLEIKIISFDEDNSNVDLIQFVQYYTHRNNTPIYITNASFLI